MIPAILVSVAGSVLSSLMQRILSGPAPTPSASPEALETEDFSQLLGAQAQGPQPAAALQPVAIQPSPGGAASAVGLLGRTVSANGTSFSLASGQAASLAFSLPSAAAGVIVQVRDQSGTVLRTVSLGAQGPGSHRIAFDGLNDQGQPLPWGTYTYRVAAVDPSGQAVAGACTASGRVTGISTENGQTVLLVGGQRIRLASVVGIQTGTTP